MKKYLISICFILVLLSGVVYADSVSLIGKKVQGQTDVLLNGKKIDDVVIIDGKSYAPVRTISEAVGVDVDFKDGKVILTTEEQVEIPIEVPTGTTEEPANTQEKPLTKQQLIYKLDSLETEYTLKNKQLESLETDEITLNRLLDQYKGFVEKGQDVESNTKNVQTYEGYITDNLAEQTKLESELATLNATIANVKDQISKM